MNNNYGHNIYPSFTESRASSGWVLVRVYFGAAARVRLSPLLT